MLTVILGRPEQRFYQRQIAQLAGLRLVQVQRALHELTEIGILRTEREGNRVYYTPEPSCAILPELRSLIYKTTGLFAVLREELGHVPDIRLAFVYGSMAKGGSDFKSDVDVLIVTDTPFATVAAAIAAAQKRLGREISPLVYSTAEFTEKLSSRHHFIMRVLQEPTVPLIGNLDDIV